MPPPKVKASNFGLKRSKFFLRRPPSRRLLPHLSLSRSLSPPEGRSQEKTTSSISLLLVLKARAHRHRHAQGREKGRRRLWRRQEERRRKQKGERLDTVAGVVAVDGVGIFGDSSRRRFVFWPLCLGDGRGSGPAWPHQPREHLLLQLGAPGTENRENVKRAASAAARTTTIFCSDGGPPFRFFSRLG